jgi:hypothetical protein
VETQNIEQGLAAHIAQHHTKREGGDRRAKNHQHTYVDSHSGPSIWSFSLPFVRRFAHSLDSYYQCVIVTDCSVALTLVSIAE